MAGLLEKRKLLPGRKGPLPKKPIDTTAFPCSICIDCILQWSWAREFPPHAPIPEA